MPNWSRLSRLARDADSWECVEDQRLFCTKDGVIEGGRIMPGLAFLDGRIIVMDDCER